MAIDTKDIRDQVARTVSTFMTGDNFLEYLAFRRQFHTYSLNNTVLIWTQCPHATHVAGFKKWLSLDRAVRRGEKGIQIIAPMVRKDPEDEERTIVRGFKAAHVFDVSQTDGAPLPELPWQRLERMTDPEISGALVDYTAAQGITFTQDDDQLEKIGALGCYNRQTNTIHVKSTLDEAIWQHTLIHELMHHQIRKNHEKAEKLPTSVHETLAETGALMVMTALGFEPDPGSVSYIARYAEDLELFVGLLDLATQFSTPILDALEQFTLKEAITA